MKRRLDAFDVLEWAASVLIVGLLVLGILSFFAPAAEAGPAFCAQREQIAERLGTKYLEQQIGGGMQGESQLIEVWIAQGGRTWTILQTRPDGISCVMASGTDWLVRPFKAGEPS